MKILTIFATASALALSTASAFAGHAGDDKPQLSRDFYATAASGRTGGYVRAAEDQSSQPAPVNPENAVRGSIYRVSRHNDRAIARNEDRGAALMSYRRTVEQPAPVDPENAVRESIYKVSRSNDRAVKRNFDDPGRQQMSRVRDDRPYGPKYQPQEQVQHSVYDVIAGKKGNIDEYYWR